MLEWDGEHNKLLSLTVLFFEWIEHIHENFCLLSEGKISHWIYLPQLEILSASWSTNKFVCLSNFYLRLFFSFFWFFNVHQRLLHIFCILTWLSSFTCRFVHCTFKKFFLSRTCMWVDGDDDCKKCKQKINEWTFRQRCGNSPKLYCLLLLLHLFFC